MNFFDHLTLVLEWFHSFFLLASGVLAALLFFLFLWNLVKYLVQSGQREELIRRTLWSLLGLVVFTSLWGLVVLLGAVFLPDDASIQTPLELRLPGAEDEEAPDTMVPPFPTS